MDSGIADTGHDAMDAAMMDAAIDVEAGIDAPMEAMPDSGALDAGDAGPISKAWARVTFGSTLFRLAVDSNRNTLAVGWTKQLAPVMVKWDENGNALPWKANLTGNAFPQAVAFDSQGNAYVAGLVNANSDLGGGQIGPGAFVAKYDTLGNQVWQRDLTRPTFTRSR